MNWAQRSCNSFHILYYYGWRSFIFRYSSTDPLLRTWSRPCDHVETVGKNKKFRCGELLKASLVKIKNRMFATSNRQQQNVFLSHLLKVQQPKRLKKGFNEKPRSVSVSYEVGKNY